MSNNTPLVSVLIPTYNYGKYIATAIESVLAQTYKNFEIIVVDDGSTDNTAEIVKSYPQVRYFYQENKGVGAARELARTKALGEYVAFIDADDIWHKEKLERQIAYMNEYPTCRIVFTNYENFYEKAELESVPRIKEEHDTPDDKYMASCLMERNLFEEYGGYEITYRKAEDTKFLYSLMLHGVDLDNYIPETLYYRRLHGENISFTTAKLSGADLLRIRARVLREKYKSGEMKKMNNNTPLVSVLIPTYNYGKYIATAIESILAQTYKNFEIIVVDDGSTDNTAEIVKRYPQVRYFYQENKGVGAARELARTKALGEYVAFIDADDIWHKEKLERQIAYMNEHQDCRICFTDFDNFYDSPELINDEKIKEIVNCVYHHCLPTALIAKSLFEEFGGFDESRKRLEDTAFITKLGVGKVNLNHCIKEVLYYRRLHSNNLSLDAQKHAKIDLMKLLAEETRKKLYHKENKENENE